MKLLTIILFVFPFATHAQVYNRTSADQYKYKEIGDTIFINDRFFVPGDTLFLGKGSAPDQSFLNIWEIRGSGMFCFRQRFLPKEMSEKYLIYKERKKIRCFFADASDPYLIVFTSPADIKKTYMIQWYSAIELHEVRLN